MAYLRKTRGTLLIEIGGQRVHLHFRQPTAEEALSTLALKYRSSDPDRQAENILRANLELGFACIQGVGDAELIVDSGGGPEPLVSEPSREGFREEWKTVVKENFPALLVALGQHLSDVPTRIEELEKK